MFLIDGTFVGVNPLSESFLQGGYAFLYFCVLVFVEGVNHLSGDAGLVVAKDLGHGE